MMHGDEQLYYAQLQFPDEKTRDAAFLELFRVPEPDYAIAVQRGARADRIQRSQSMPTEILYKQKGARRTEEQGLTGGKKETLPTIDMIVAIGEGQDIDRAVGIAGAVFGQRRMIRDMALGLTLKSEHFSAIEHLLSGLEGACGEQIIQATKADIKKGYDYSSRGDIFNLPLFLTGPVRRLLYAYEFIQSSGLEYERFTLTFG